MRLGRVLQRAAVADMRLDDDQRRLSLDRHGLARDALEPLDREVLADVDDVPAVGLEALADILGHDDVHLARELDPVGVVVGDQAAEPEVAGERAGLGGDALLDVAVACDREDVVVDDLVLALVEAGGQHALGEREPDRHRDALAERPGRRLDAGAVLALRVAGRGRADLTEVLDVLERQRVAREVEHRIEQHRRVARGEHEAVAVRPLGVGRVVAHDPRVEHVGQRSEGHRRARMARVRLLHCIHRQRADGVDG